MKHIFIILTFTSATAFGQGDEAAVKQTINKLFEGIKKSDTAMIQEAFSFQPILQTVIKNKEGRVSIESGPLDSFLITVSKPHIETYDERITVDEIKIDGELAMV